MTSSAVFHLGGGGAASSPAASHFAWTVQHAPKSLGVGPPPLGVGDISRSLPSSLPDDPWPGAGTLRGGEAWPSPWQGGGAAENLFPAHDPFQGQGPYRARGPPLQGHYDPSGLQDAPFPPPVQWLSPPQPQPAQTPVLQDGLSLSPGTPESLGDDWRHGPRQWSSSGQGVVSLLPWFLGMTVLEGADAQGGVSASRANPAANRPAASRPGSRPGPARPGTRTGAGPVRGQGTGAAGAAAAGGGTASTDNGHLHELYRWKQVDYEFPDEATRAKARADGDYIPENNLPLGLEAYRDRIFVSIPRWKPGVPATLAYVSRYPNGDASPRLQPYPDWSWHRVPRAGQNDSCQALTSVFRMTADECGRLWVIDSGAVDAIGDIRVVCPPQIVIFDLKTDRLLWRYVIPKSQTKPESLFTNIVVDIRDGQCDDAFAYSADVFRYGLLVYSWREDRSYRLTHNLFYPDPIAARFVLDDVTFRWMDGIFGLALSPVDKKTSDRTLFFHPMASFREFAVQTSVIRNETFANEHPDDFRILGVRGRNQSHSSASAMDRRGVLFFNLVTQDALGCWDSGKAYGRSTVGHVAKDSALINFPNDLKVDREEPQNIWLLSNRLHLFLYRALRPDEYNFRILTGTVEEATKGTICDPSKVGPATYVPKSIDACEDS